MHCPHQLLVIGYGNTLRRDDGVGVLVAEAVAALHLPGVFVLVRHQLVPELAEPVAQSDAVVFVDADAHTDAGGEVQLQPIQAEAGTQILAHVTSPGSVLALANQFFGQRPAAWTLSIPVEDLGVGDGLSPRAAAGYDRALREIKALADRLLAATR